jgi:hypothetical protein
MGWASGQLANVINILDDNGWAKRDIITNGDKWAHLGNM